MLDPHGQAFNPEFHEAMVTQQPPTQPPGTVLHVVQKGFTLNGRLLRPARVIIVARAGRRRTEGHPDLNRRVPGPT